MTGVVIKKLGDDISTDIIYPGRYMATILPSETAQYAFADDKMLNEMLTKQRALKGSIILAGKNFGCGSSRQQAVSTLKGHELIIIAKDIAHIFLENAIKNGLFVVICPEIEAEENDELELTENKIINLRTGAEYAVTPFTKTQKEVMSAGGLIPYVRSILLAQKKGVAL